MKYPHIVIANGKWYKAGEDVPETEEKTKEVTETSDKPSIDRKEIERMKYFSLKSLAEKYGIDTTDKKAVELKAELIERLGL